MAVIRTPLPNAAFTLVRNCWLRDDRISLKAKGLLAYLSSHADGYKCSQAQMVRESTDGREAVKTGLEELEAAGYLRRMPTRSAGRFAEDDYALADPFDADGRLLWETRASSAGDTRETRQSGFAAAGEPQRETRPLEEQEEKNKTPTESLFVSGRHLAAVEPPGLAAAAAFDTFWAAYPRKVGKDAARRAWGKVTRSTDPAVIIAAVRAYPFPPDQQFVPHPTTWLNQGRWQDDPAAVTPRTVTRRAYGAHQPYRDPDPASSGAFPERF